MSTRQTQTRRVRVLPDALANRIAAGEVVERPASVVKELVENAVDAGAGRVRVRVERSGKERVSVEDDGVGMTREDALLALERHATSKIRSAEDLEGIRTLGFRGEALPSIASVSRFTLRTRSEEDAAGTMIRLEGGTVVSVEAVGSARGSTVEVEDLFYNVPARRKFLKSDATELRNTVESMTELALVHHAVGFELRSGARSLLAVPPGQTLEERASELVGGEARGGLHWFGAESEDRSLTLAHTAPHEGRGHRRGIRLFVNGRPVQDRLLFRALMEGYRGLLEGGRYPVALLWVLLPPEDVDVNVHPAKREVRFREEREVFRWVSGLTAQALSRAPWVASPGSPAPSAPDGRVDAPVEPLPAGTGCVHVQRVAEAVERYAARPGGDPVAKAWGEGFNRPASGPRATAPSVPMESLEDVDRAGVESGLRGRFGHLRYLGAFDATYLLFEDLAGRDLLVLDQHAAHERILFEALVAGGTGGRAQPLLFPVTLECSPAERAAYEERREALEGLGFAVELFGPTSLAVTEAPSPLGPAQVETVVRDLLAADELETEGAGPRERVEVLARRAACSGAVKARAALDRTEAEALVGRLEKLTHPTHCPHGRPLILRLSRGELETMFRRK